MPKQKNPEELSVREKKFIKEIGKGKSKRQAAFIATNSSTIESASVQANRMLSKDSVKNALAAELEKQGITLEAAIKPIKKALEATKVQIHGDGNEAFAEVVDDVDLQLKGSDRALKLMGVHKEVDAPSGTFIQVNNNYKDKYS